MENFQNHLIQFYSYSSKAEKNLKINSRQTKEDALKFVEFLDFGMIRKNFQTLSYISVKGARNGKKKGDFWLFFFFLNTFVSGFGCFYHAILLIK